jgi:hypothetical protein
MFSVKKTRNQMGRNGPDPDKFIEVNPMPIFLIHCTVKTFYN